MIKYDSVFFDLDGTLWDASSATALAWEEVLRNNPEIVPCERPDRDFIRRYMGLTNEEIAGIMFPDLSPDMAFSYVRKSCEIENKLLPEIGGELYPCVCTVLKELHDCGYKLFVVSNCQDGYIDAFLHAHSMYGVINDTESSGRTGLSKAENIKLVIKRNCVSSPVMVGDTASDLEAARENGIPFIYAAYGFGEKYGRGKCDQYDVRLEKLSDLPAIFGERKHK